MSLRDNMNVLRKHKNIQNFSVPIEKEVTKFDKGCNESVETTSYKIEFTDSARFMSSSLSNLVYISH